MDGWGDIFPGPHGRKSEGLREPFWAVKAGKIENLSHAVSLHFMHYNFARIHRSLRVTPAMEAGVSDHLWSIEDIVGLLEEKEQVEIQAGALERGSYKKRAS